MSNQMTDKEYRGEIPPPFEVPEHEKAEGFSHDFKRAFLDYAKEGQDYLWTFLGGTYRYRLQSIELREYDIWLMAGGYGFSLKEISRVQDISAAVPIAKAIPKEVEQPKRIFPKLGAKDYIKFLEKAVKVKQILYTLQLSYGYGLRAEFLGIPEVDKLSEEGRMYEGSDREQANKALCDAETSVATFITIMEQLVEKSRISEIERALQ